MFQGFYGNGLSPVKISPVLICVLESLELRILAQKYDSAGLDC